MKKSQMKESKTAKASVPMRERRLDCLFYSPMSLAALPWLSYETKLSGIVRHSKVQVKALSAYFHSIVKNYL